MVALAWLMSSHRWKVDWRLVIFGVGLQFVLAALFFNSQNWKFPICCENFSDLVQACDQGIVDVDVCQQVWNTENSGGGEFVSNFAQYESKKLALPAFEAESGEFPESGLVVPRFPNGIVFYVIESFFSMIQESVDAGANLVFEAHPAPDDEPATHPRAILTTFAFGVLPTVIFFAALMSVLYYLGLMQILVRAIGWVMEKTLRTSPSESLAAAANVLLGHTEAPLVVKPYVPTMTRSELNALMVGGFSTISGSLMAIFANIGVSAGHLLTASIISAPAALVIAKILQPETEKLTELHVAESQALEKPCNVIEAAANGATEGIKLAINIAAMLIAFLAMITFVDILLQTFFGWFGMSVSLGLLFGYVFAPIAWLMGIESKDCLVAGDMLGTKMVVNEFVAYLALSDVPTSTGVASGGISERTRTILTYALCGFSNFGAIGIQLGGIGPLAPERKAEMAQLGLRAMFGGMLAACMTACIAGIFFGVLS